MSGGNALFMLACGCILDGCHDSSPGIALGEGRTGTLRCDEHGWVLLTGGVALEPWRTFAPATPTEENEE